MTCSRAICLVGHVQVVEKDIKAKVDTKIKCPESGETPLHLVALVNYKVENKLKHIGQLSDYGAH